LRLDDDDEVDPTEGKADDATAAGAMGPVERKLRGMCASGGGLGLPT
jgi:hypothetical protein